MHASLLAAVANGPLQTDGVLFVADDMLGKGSRQQRMRGAARDKAQSLKIQRAAEKAKPPQWIVDIPKKRAESKRVN